MRIWIPTMAGDFHSATVALEMRARGHEVALFYGEDYPQRLTQSARIGTELDELQVGETAFTGSRSADVVWNRRRMAFSMPQRLHKDDTEFVRRELRACADGVWANVADAAFWVNPHEAAARAKHKLSQLRLARRLGFSIPETLMSNDPQAIRAFVRDSGRAVYKSFTPAYWQTQTGTRSLLASLITEQDLPEDDTGRLCPGIYQSFVKQRFEVRATVFGRTVMAIRINPSGTGRTIDYREGHLSGLATEPFVLPSDVQEKLIAFMNCWSLRFGCFDLVMAEDGRYYFLEVNEAGQFLWLEDLQPSVPILDAFCTYLESMDDEFLYRQGNPPRSLASWRHTGEPERLMRPAFQAQPQAEPAEA